MTSRQERRVLWTLLCVCGVMLCALPLAVPTARYPLLAFGAGVVLLVVGGWMRWRIRRHRQRFEP